MTEPRNAPAYAELLEWMEEAVEYVNKGSMSPSLEAEGRKLLRLAAAPSAPASILKTKITPERRAQLEKAGKQAMSAYNAARLNLPPGTTL